MKTFRIIVFTVTLFLGGFAGAQFKQADYLDIIDALDLNDMRGTMLGAASHGLNPKAYWTDGMESSYQQVGPSPLLKAQANENYLRLLGDVSLGVVDPESLGTDIKIQRKMFIAPLQLKVLLLASGTKAGPLIESLAPQHAPYRALKGALNKISTYCEQGEWTALPNVPFDLRLGSKSSVIPALKNRMRQLGYNITSTDEVLDEEMFSAVKDIQWTLRMNPDGVISPKGRTWKYLNVSCADRMRQIRLDMEKLRWFPQQFEDRYIFINTAMAYFTLVDKSSGSLNVMSFRTINGRTARKTPTMKDRIVYIIINPFWVVPPTIFKEDKVEEIRRLQPSQVTDYFNSHNYEVWNASFTRKIDPTTINWWKMDPTEDGDFYIRQRPNYMNALGVLKFMLTNSFAIYLHDTNQRQLFVEPQRLLSSGCIRLERPMDLAEYLLQGTPWTRELIEKYAAKPGEVLDAETRVPLKKSVPVYLVFLTSQQSSDGVIRFVEDSYEQGKRLLQAGVW